MEVIAPNRILVFKPNQLMYVRKQHNFDKPGDMSHAIDILEAWIKQQNHFTKKDFARNYLEKIIIDGKGSIERAKSKLDKMCTFRTVMPDFFGDNLTKNKFEDLDVFKSGLLPHPTDETYRVYILKAKGSTFTHDQLMNCYRCIVLICEYITAYDYSDGCMIVIDYTETNIIELIKAMSLMELRQIFTIVTEGFAMRLKGIHLLTSSKAVDTLVAIFKQLISAKLGKRIFVHRDISTLYQYVPKDTLPVEYGGKEKSFNELSDDLMGELTSTDFIQYMEEMNSAKTAESCRQTATFNEQYLGMPGTFRTLNVD